MLVASLSSAHHPPTAPLRSCLSVLTTRNVFRHCKVFPEDPNHLWLSTPSLDRPHAAMSLCGVLHFQGTQRIGFHCSREVTSMGCGVRPPGFNPQVHSFVLCDLEPVTSSGFCLMSEPPVPHRQTRGKQCLPLRVALRVKGTKLGSMGGTVLAWVSVVSTLLPPVRNSTTPRASLQHEMKGLTPEWKDAWEGKTCRPPPLRSHGKGDLCAVR